MPLCSLFFLQAKYSAQQPPQTFGGAYHYNSHNDASSLLFSDSGSPKTVYVISGPCAHNFQVILTAPEEKNSTPAEAGVLSLITGIQKNLN